MSGVAAAVSPAPVPGNPRLGLRGRFLAWLWVTVLFSNLPLYLSEFFLPQIFPLYWIVALFGLALLLLDRSAWRDEAPLFVGALAGYAAMCLVWFVVQGGGDPMLLRGRLLGLTVCAASYLVFASSPAALRAARLAMVLVVLVSVAINMWDITHPFGLIPADSEHSIVGRAAGLFINPNQSGAALVAGFALSVSVVPGRWRVPYLVAVAVGVVLTLSRAAMLGLAAVSFALALRGRTLSWRQLLGATLVVSLAGYLAWRVTAAELETRYHIDPAVVADRLLWILDPTGRADYSQEERAVLMERGWEQFVAAPLLGNGVGSTELWQERTSTHNVYIMLASDFGVVGLLAFPFLVFAATRFRLTWFQETTVAGLFLLFWGLFSHNVLGEFYLLVALGMIAALSRAEARDRAPGAHRTAVAGAR